MSRSRRSLFHSAPLALALLASCGAGDPAEVHLYAAASLRDAVLAIEPLYEAESGCDLVPNFGSSGQLRAQIQKGGAADVFVSAGVPEMDALDEAGLLAQATRRDLLSNELVVVVPKGERRPKTPQELGEPWLERLAMGEPKTVPVGRYTVAWLAAIGVWPLVKERVLPCADVRAALAAVETGTAEAGIVYRTDAMSSESVDIAFAAGPEAPPIAYPAAVLAGRPDEARARALLDFLAGPRAAEIFEGAGFLATGAP